MSPDADDHSAWQSPARDEIVFVSDRDGSMDLFLADLAGEKLRNLTSSPDRDEYAPHWSPDGERIAAIVVPRGAPMTASESTLGVTHVLAIDRSGRTLLETPGAMPDWMPPP